MFANPCVCVSTQTKQLTKPSALALIASGLVSSLNVCLSIVYTSAVPVGSMYFSHALGFLMREVDSNYHV